MNNSKMKDMIVSRLERILESMCSQRLEVASHYSPDQLSLDEEIAQIKELLRDANEFVLAYESIIANLESVPFSLSGKCAVGLLEVALLLRFKTERNEDAVTDHFKVHHL